MLGNEIDYLHARFREAEQRGDMMLTLKPSTMTSTSTLEVKGSELTIQGNHFLRFGMQIQELKMKEKKRKLKMVMILLKEVMEVATTPMAMRSSTWH